MRFSRRTTAVPLLLTLSLASGFAAAEPVYGLVTLNIGAATTSPMYLDRFDSATPGTATTFASNNSSLVVLQGVVAGQAIKSIDFRPATGELFALSTNGSTAAQLYTVNLMTGQLTTVGTGFMLAANTSPYVSIDFNPVVDRIRIVTADGSNYRANPLNGALVQADTTLNENNTRSAAAISGLAYSNNVNGATTTTLYGYSYASDTLRTIGGLNGNPSPNSGTVFNVGASGLLSSSQYIGLDIDAAGLAFGSVDVDDDNGGSSNFYSVNLTTGAFSLIGAEAFRLLDFAVQVGPSAPARVPEPETLALLGFGAAALAGTRRRRRSASV